MPRVIDVGILGATGAVGQQFVSRLAGPPVVQTHVGGPPAIARHGRRLRRISRWAVASAVSRRRPRLSSSTSRSPQPRTAIALSPPSTRMWPMDLEPALARAGHIVVSNTRSHRMDPTVPLLVPELNPEHLSLLPIQRQARGWSGAIVTNPNCSTTILVMALGALAEFGLKKVIGVDAPGRHPAPAIQRVASLDLLGNVIPIHRRRGAEARDRGQQDPRPLRERCRRAAPARRQRPETTRVPVVDGHTELVSIGIRTDRVGGRDRSRPASVRRTSATRGAAESAPAQAIVLSPEKNRPQPRLDVNVGNGNVGHRRAAWRPCPILGWKFVVLGHNTVRGAAGGALLNAELMVQDGLIGS